MRRRRPAIRAQPRAAWSGALAACVAIACGGPTRSEEAASDDATDHASVPAVDPLLARARRSMNRGKVAPEIRAELMSSTDPRHARARRLLPLIDGEEPPDTDEPEAAAPSIQVRPSENASADDPAAPRRGDTPAAAFPGGPAATPPVPPADPEAAAPRLAVITRLELRGGKRSVTLRLRAAARVDVGVVEQKSSGTVRLMARSAGALPAVLDSRPSAGGVTITDVRRGEGTLQIAVALADGWRADEPRSDADGATIRFRAQ